MSSPWVDRSQNEQTNLGSRSSPVYQWADEMELAQLLSASVCVSSSVRDL